MEEQAEAVQQIAREHGGHDFEWAVDPEARARLWDARHTGFLACLELRPGARAFVTDACVPISRLAECIAATIEDIGASSLPCPILGHVGDGNFHCIILADPGDPAEMEEAERLNRRVMRRALAMDGTCTGEHGVGLHKVALLGEEFGDAAVDLMRRLKAAWDPLNILNPGKIVTTTRAAAGPRGPEDRIPRSGALRRRTAGRTPPWSWNGPEGETGGRAGSAGGVRVGADRAGGLGRDERERGEGDGRAGHGEQPSRSVMIVGPGRSPGIVPPVPAGRE